MPRYQCDAALSGELLVGRNIAASVRERLLQTARARDGDSQKILTLYTLERLLYRIGQSQYADKFMLKGALLFALWYDKPHRTTRDADLLGLGQSDLETVSRIFQEISTLPFEDGVLFRPDAIKVEEIRKQANYNGVSVFIPAEIDKARCLAKVDIGFGDAVTPEAEHVAYPVLLSDMPPPLIRAYPVYTVIAEKLHAIAELGLVNSRMKDYFDLSVLLERETLDEDLLVRAIRATFERRGTKLTSDLPDGLTDDFALDPSLQALWQGFLKKNRLESEALDALVKQLRTSLEPVLLLAARQERNPEVDAPCPSFP
jgi:predicted nucleotidyltransferase component of viral defense system